MIAFSLAVAVLLSLAAGCSVAMKQRLSGTPIEPSVAIADLQSLEKDIQTNKQIFRVRLLDKGRTFSGDGALFFRAPDTLQMSIYGPPFTTLWMQMLQRGDSITVVLPKENRVVRARRGNTENLTRLSSSEGLTDGEFLGGVTGIFNLSRFRHPGMREEAAEDGSLRSLRLIGDGSVYEFTFDRGLRAVVRFAHYEDGKLRREISRSEFKPRPDGLQRATRTVYRDFVEDREITVLVSKEEINQALTGKAFDITLPEGQ